VSATLWGTIDEPVLRWVASLPPSLEVEIQTLQVREPEPFPHVAGLDSRGAHESLLRLRSHALIDGNDHGTTHYVAWSRLRVTADGWKVLGEWPDLDRVATAASIHGLLRILADEAPDEERDALLRAAGVAARTADAVLRDTVTDVAKTVGEDVVNG
jgi:hypothetical protein